MAKSATNRFQWPDGSWHSIDWANEQQRKSEAQGTVGINGVPVTQAQWANGALAESLVPGSTSPGGVAAPVAAQPIDPTYEAAKNAAGYNIGLSNSEANYQQGQTAYNTGYNADGSLNTSDPYSQAQLLQDSYHRSQLGTTNSLASQGQLYSGALANAQGTNDRNYAQSSDALKRSAADTYHTIGTNQLTSYANNALGTNDAGFSALLKSVYGS